MSDPIDISKLPTFMLREIVAGETKPQPEGGESCAQTTESIAPVTNATGHSPDCASNAAPQGFNPPAGAAKRPKLTMQEARELSADIARRAEERRKAAVALECTPPPQQPGGTPEDTPETDAKWNAIVDDENTSQTIGGTKWKAVAIRLCEEMRTLETQRNEARAALAAAQAEVERLMPLAYETRPGLVRPGDPGTTWGEAEQRALRKLYATQDELEQTRRELAEARKIDIPQAVLCLFDEIPSGQVTAKGLRADSLTVLNALKNRAFALIDDNAALRQALTAAEQELAAIETGTLVKLLRERLTAAEQRASGAEKERDTLMSGAEITTRIFDQITQNLTAQRDTAIRERDAEKAKLAQAQKDTARIDWLARDGNIDKTHCDAMNGPGVFFVDNFESQIGLRTAIDAAALAAKTTEGGV